LFLLFFQHKLHENFGGVVPSLARQAHQDSIDAVVAEALAQANLGSAEYVFLFIDLLESVMVLILQYFVSIALYWAVR
jgi:hypothetical protein